LTPTSKLVLDSWAWVELLTGSEKGRKVESRILSAEQVYTTTFSLAEVISVTARRGRPSEKAAEVIRSNSKILAPSGDDSIESGLIPAKSKSERSNLSLADSFVLQSARKLGAKVLTGDPDFQGVKDAELFS